MSTQSSSPNGRTVLVTGSTRGLGWSLARELAAGGATLLLHGRDRTRLAEAEEEVRAAAPGATVRGYAADLADLDQVRELADTVLNNESRLDVLVNNAAIGAGPTPQRREGSAQGHELRFAVNYLAPYVLTRRLLPLLKSSAPARVVDVASAGQEALDFDDIMMERHYDGMRAYCRSKVALIMWTFDLAAEVESAGITVNALHPAALMDTRLVHRSGLTPATSVEEGVKPALRLVTDPALEHVTGRYFHRFTDSRADEQTYDPAARARLAELTAVLTSE